MEKLNKTTGQSMDIVADNITKLKELFPEILTENRIDFKALQALLGEEIEVEDERYSFNWHGKAQARRLAQSPSTGTLRPCKEESVDWDSTQNLFIEGDNLEVLKLMQKSYHKQVKMIYIDPPYNTGNDFVYPDNFRDNIQNYLEITGQTESGKKLATNTEASGRYHTDWLNMMYPRLKLARNLLRDDGVIFISIDDNEVSNLRKLCDEVFGEDNFVGILSVENNPKGRKNSAFISVSSEYCVIYAKHKSNAYFIENIPKKASDMTEDEDGGFVHGSGKRVLVGENSFNKYVTKIESDKNYSVYYREKDRQLTTKKEAFNIVDQQLIDNGYIKYFSQNEGMLVENTYTESTLCELFQKRALEFSSDKIYEKNFSDTIRIKSQLVNRNYEAVVRGKKQTYSMELTTTGAGTDLKNLFDATELLFPSPKNIGYLKLLISLFEKESFITLDFFSGSSSTAHAVMQLNTDDGGNRKFIMVQLPESCDEKSEAFKAGYSNIAEIGKERIRRAAKKIQAENPLFAGDLGFKVFKLDSSNLKPWDATFDSLAQDLAESTNVIKDDRLPEDVLFEILLKYGLDLTLPIDTHSIAGKTVYEVGAGALIVCLDGGVTEAVAEGIGKLKEKLEPEVMRVVFKDSSFASDAAKVNAVQVLKQYGIDDVKSI